MSFLHNLNMYDDSKAFPSHTEHLGEITIIYHHVCQGGTLDRSQVMRMIESGQKSKPKIIPKASNKTQRNH